MGKSMNLKTRSISGLQIFAMLTWEVYATFYFSSISLSIPTGYEIYSVLPLHSRIALQVHLGS